MNLWRTAVIFLVASVLAHGIPRDDWHRADVIGFSFMLGVFACLLDFLCDHISENQQRRAREPAVD